MDAKRRGVIAGVLVGIARSETRETIESVAESLISGAGWGDRFSPGYLTKERLPKLIEALRKEPTKQRAGALLAELFDEYEAFAVVHVVWLPIKNLVVPPEGLTVGNFGLRTINEEAIDEAEQNLRPAITSPPNPPEAADHFVGILRRQYEELIGQTVAVIRVVCQREIAKDQAREQYDQLIDFINGAATFLYPHRLRIRVGAPGEVNTERETILVFSDPAGSFSLPMSWVGPLYPVELDEATVTRLRETGYWAFTEILGKSKTERTEFERALLIALHWYANHLRQTTLANQLLSLTIAAEAIFPRRGSGIGLSSAEGVAFVLSEAANERLRIREQFRDLYSKRSDVAHRGLAEISERDVLTMAHYVLHLLLAVVARRSEFETTNDLERWVDSRRLAGAAESVSAIRR